MLVVNNVVTTGERSADINFLFKENTNKFKESKKKSPLHLKLLMIKHFVMLGVIALISY